MKKSNKTLPIVAGIVAAIAVIGGVFYFTAIRPKHIAADLTAKAAAMGDIQYSAEVAHTVGDTRSAITAEGFYLPTAKQMSASISVTQGESKVDTSRITLDGEALYIDTRTLFSTTGKYWLGDMNSDKYYEQMYDSIFAADTTRFHLGDYALPYWDHEERWFSELKSCSDILKEEAENSIRKNAKYAYVKDGVKMQFSSTALANVINAIGNQALIDNNYIYQSLTRSAKAYSIEAPHHSGQFIESFSEYAQKLADERESDAETGMAAQEAQIQQLIQSLIDTVNTNEFTASYTVKETDGAIIQAIRLEKENESFEITLTRRASYKTYLDDVPDDFEEFGIQVTLLEDAYDTVFSAPKFE